MDESMYQPDDRDRAIFGELYQPPAVFIHSEWHTVAALPADSDGQDCEIQECRLPRSFRLIVFPAKNYDGKLKRGWSLSTGTGDTMGHLMIALAKAVADGMVAYHNELPTGVTT